MCRRNEKSILLSMAIFKPFFSHVHMYVHHTYHCAHVKNMVLSFQLTHGFRLIKLRLSGWQQAPLLLSHLASSFFDFEDRVSWNSGIHS